MMRVIYYYTVLLVANLSVTMSYGSADLLQQYGQFGAG